MKLCMTKRDEVNTKSKASLFKYMIYQICLPETSVSSQREVRFEVFEVKFLLSCSLSRIIESYDTYCVSKSTASRVQTRSVPLHILCDRSAPICLFSKSKDTGLIH